MQTNNKPSVAIVVVTYNRADVTCLMMDSLVKAETSVDFKLYLVDNQSKPEERTQIREKFESLVASTKIKGIFTENPVNNGYSGGNNVGIKQAFADEEITHICLLNNDTIVSHRWLENILAHSVHGLIGPVSNSVGNEQIIPLMYVIKGVNQETLENAMAFGDRWHRSHQGQLERTPMLGFFCVMGPIEVFKAVGYLDEEFGIGTYEDDDYCYRARGLGFEIAIARDVFVHHWGSASFSKLNRDFFVGLVKRNKLYYERKHKTVWRPYAATIVDAYKFEMIWLGKKGGDELVQEAVQKYENLLKGYILHMYSSTEEICNKTFLETIDWKLGITPGMNRYVRAALRLIVLAQNAMFGGQGTSVEFFKRVRHYWSRLKNEHSAK